MSPYNQITFDRHYNGWRVIHGIVESIGVEAVDNNGQTGKVNVAQETSEAVTIRLMYEDADDRHLYHAPE